jgi:hypothetical protein
MRDPSYELDSGEAATMLLAFAQARQQGYQADAFTVALVDVLRRQLVNCDDGMEEEFDVQDSEDDRPDDEPVGDEFEDGEFSSLEPDTYRPLVHTKARVA